MDIIKMNTEENQKFCQKCKFFEERSGFCRKHPPKSIVTSDKDHKQIVTVFPKIPIPTVDYCWEFEEK